tara:strand:- start:1357 stop:2193 length:837 start_codon:yes stop_codon:yes gene_type:complete
MLGLGIAGAVADTQEAGARLAGSSFSNQYSVDFDGVNDTVTLPNTTFWQGLLGSFDWSISYWCKYPTAFNPSVTAANNGLNNFAGVNSSFQVETVIFGTLHGPNFGTASLRNRMTFQALLQGTDVVFSTNTVDLSSIISDDTWFHVVFATEKTNGTRSSKIYINGVDRTDTDTSATFRFGNISATGGLIGAQDFIGSISNFTEMNIDECSVYSEALTSSKVTAIYNGGVPLDESSRTGLIGYWRFGDGDNLSGTTVLDQSSNSNNFTLSGATFLKDAP